jgi:hypothetical protein
MREFDDGQYWIQVGERDEPEVARYTGEVWLLHGMEEPFETTDFYRIGQRVEPGPDAFEPTVWPVPTA